ncbi:MAG: hypothetical protein ACRDR6_05330, partial [Pseudonocardiaceae bacterium]
TARPQLTFSDQTPMSPTAGTIHQEIPTSPAHTQRNWSIPEQSPNGDLEIFVAGDGASMISGGKGGARSNTGSLDAEFQAAPPARWRCHSGTPARG